RQPLGAVKKSASQGFIRDEHATKKLKIPAFLVPKYSHFAPAAAPLNATFCHLLTYCIKP
ncbi:MAG: hypothetical protein AAGF89_09540, partial [Bacteroidota bacterium]